MRWGEFIFASWVQMLIITGWKNFSIGFPGTPWEIHWEKNSIIEKNFDPQKLKQTLYLCWGMLISPFWVQLMMIKNLKNILDGINETQWYSSNTVASQWKKLWSSKTQRNLIFMLKHAHLYFLSAILDDNRVKIFFQWYSMRLNGLIELNEKPMKKNFGPQKLK